MALSGRINGTVTNLANHYSFYLDWEAEMSIAESCYYITVSSFFATDNASYTFDTVGNRNMSITIDGDTISTAKRINCNPFPANNKYLIQTISRKKVINTTTGTKSIVISSSVDGTANSGDNHYGPSYSPSQPCTASATITLDAIPKYATLTYAPNFTDQSNPTIRYSNPLGNNVTSLEVGITYSGGTAVAFRPISKTADTYTFNFTSSERDALRNITVSSSRQVNFVLKTTYSGTTNSNSLTRTLQIENTAETRPTVSLSVSCNNGTLPSTFDGIFIQGRSKADVSVTAVGKYNATIQGIRTSVGGAIYTGASFTSSELTATGNISVSTSATDSRGQMSSDSTQITVVPYTKPTITHISGAAEIQCYRADANGDPKSDSTYVWISAKVNYSPIEVNGTPKNNRMLQFRYKTASASTYGNWLTLSLNSNGEYNALLSTSVFIFSTATAYNLQLKGLDTIGESTPIITFDIPDDSPTVHFAPGGTEIGIGRNADTSKPNSVSVASTWTSYFPGGFFGNHKPITATSITDLPTDCGEGITPFLASASTSGIPPSIPFEISAGIIYKMNSNRSIIILVAFITKQIAIQTYDSSGTPQWSGWTYLTPQ